MADESAYAKYLLCLASADKLFLFSQKMQIFGARQKSAFFGRFARWGSATPRPSLSFVEAEACGRATRLVIYGLCGSEDAAPKARRARVTRWSPCGADAIMVYYSRVKFSYFKGTLEVGSNTVHEAEPNTKRPCRNARSFCILHNKKWSCYITITFIILTRLLSCGIL